jgi:glycerol 3-phosphatase-1
MNLAHPEFLVTAEDVENGKPDPTCYEMGKMKLALSHEQPSFVVFEDAPAGIRAGKAAGCVVVALNTTHTVDQLRQAGADVIVRDMHSVALKAWNQASGEVEIEITDAVV